MKGFYIRHLASAIAILFLSAVSTSARGERYAIESEPDVSTKSSSLLKYSWESFTDFIEENISSGDESVRLAVKTNGLGLISLIPNAGAEVYLGKNWSISASWNHAWWHSDKALWYWRTYGGEVAGRKWFGRQAIENPLSGHHIGLYAQMLTYDFLLGKKGILGDKWSYAGGFEYGYSFPLNNCLRLDLALGVGFMGGEYMTYVPMDGHYVWQSTMKRHYFGPTKAEASLVWIMDFNKGGRKR